MFIAHQMRARIALIAVAVIGVAGLNLAAGSGPASAATVVIDASGSGGFRVDGLSTSSNYYVGHDNSGYQTRDYFTFDLRRTTRAVDSAFVSLTNGIACGTGGSSGAPDTFALHFTDAKTSDLFRAGGYPAGDGTGKGIYSSLGGGTVFGQTVLTNSDENPVTVIVNAAGIKALNAALGSGFVVAGSYAEDATGPQHIFVGTDTTCGVSLHLHFAPQDQTITFPSTGNVAYGDPPFALAATASSGLSVDYAVQFGPCSVSGSTLTITGAGPCDVRATQAGNDDWAPADPVDRVIDVFKASTVTTVSAQPPSVPVGKPVTVTATVTPHRLPFYGATPPSGNMQFFVDGSSSPVATVAVVDGSASFTATLGAGMHTVTAKYSGDANYFASDSSASPTSVNVVCDVTITGTHSSLSVTKGSACLSRATITGGISVAKGAILDVERSTVKGSISANGAVGFRICGSTTGAIAVSGATGPVVIGDAGSADLCTGNKVSSGITVANNKAPVVVVGNTVPRVTAANNTGGQTISGNHR